MTKQTILGAGLALALILGIAVFCGGRSAQASSAPAAASQDFSPTIAFLAEEPAPKAAEAPKEAEAPKTEASRQDAKAPAAAPAQH